MTYETAEAQRAVAADFQAAHSDVLDRSSIMGVAYGVPFAADLESTAVGVVVFCREGKQEKIKQALPAQFRTLPVYVEELTPPTAY